MEKQNVIYRIRNNGLFFAILCLILSGLVVYLLVGQNSVMATVNGEKITKDQFILALKNNGGVDVLDQIISNRIVLQEANKLGIIISDDAIDAEIDKIIVENYGGMADYFQTILDQYGITEESLREDLKVNLILKQIVMSKIEITEDEKLEYFENNRELFDIPEQVRARHILVETEEEAVEILEQLRNGEDFVALAKENSLDTASLEADGDLGYIRSGATVKEFEEVAFSLALGVYSDPVKTDYGFHIIEVLDKKEARAVSFDEVKTEVEEALLNSLVSTQIEEKYNALLAAAKIKNNLY